MDKYTKALYNNAKIETLVENKIQYNTDDIELNLFETKEQSYDFSLQFSDLSLISMYEGKKVMKLDKKNEFEFHPYESLVLDKYTKMKIDFPIATMEKPTRCMALIISQDEIKNTLNLINEKNKEYFAEERKLESSTIKFENSLQLNQSITKIVNLATSENPYKTALSKIATQELIISLMQTNAKSQLLRHSKVNLLNNPLAYALNYICEHIDQNIDLDDLARKSFMSKATFFRHFKYEMGITPWDFVINEKVKKAKELLKNFNHSIADIAFSLSFSSASHFIQLFKKNTGYTPNGFRQNFK